MNEFLPEQYVPFIDPTEAVFIMDPKEAARLAYGRSRSESSYATLVEKKKELSERRSARLAEREWKQDHMPTVDQLIEESFGSTVEPEEPDWSHMGWLVDDSSTEGPAPIYYDGPYNPVKEATRKEAAAKAADTSMMFKAEYLLDALHSGSMTRGDALRSLFDAVSGNNREVLIDMMEDHVSPEHTFTDPDLEFRVLMGASRIAIRSTFDVNPFNDQHSTYGFAITQLEL